MGRNKLHGCGNSFFVVDEEKQGIVADKVSYVIEKAEQEKVDGILFLTRSDSGADLEMKMFDRDGTEETMCGNGIRCFVRYAYDNGYIGNHADILTGDGVKRVEVKKNLISVVMGEPRQFKRLDDSRYFVFTGVPHMVYFVSELCLDEAFRKGREMRYDKQLCSLLGHESGICVTFAKVNAKKEISIMTYEVGVEDVTRACGTGSTGAAYVSHVVKGCSFPIKVRNIGGDITIDYKESQLVMTGNVEYF